jgi:hypothetical protein
VGVVEEDFYQVEETKGPAAGMTTTSMNPI